jgi:hypothetical protein
MLLIYFFSAGLLEPLIFLMREMKKTFLLARGRFALE